MLWLASCRTKLYREILSIHLFLDQGSFRKPFKSTFPMQIWTYGHIIVHLRPSRGPEEVRKLEQSTIPLMALTASRFVGTVSVCHHGAGFCGLSFAHVASQLVAQSSNEMGVLA